MCGIAGYLTNGAAADRALLQRMCDRLAHRGPDGEGYHCEGHVALGHRRLSIIDVAGGAQPLTNEDASVWVTFNGEIYNYQDLSSTLRQKGHRFSTQCDTEVLVHLYEEVGERLPEYLNGMFAFAIWDSRRRELFLARDRFGKKPLYYSFSVPGFRFCFASELKALTAMPGFPQVVDPRSVADFLCLDYIPDPETIYQNVYKLLPGHSLQITDSGHRLRKYWEPSFAIDPAPDLPQAVKEIRALAQDCVSCRMISDVPLGAFLSGGIDSSAAVAFMAGHASEPVKTFSIGFTNKRFDELKYARLIADRYQTSHREQVVSPSVHEMLGTLVEHFDEPFGDSSAIPTLYLTRMTRAHVVVALCGDGADELFGGYRRYLFGVLEDRLRSLIPGWLQRPIGTVGRYYPKFDYLPRMFRAKTLLTNLAQQIGDAYFTSMTAFRDRSLETVLSDNLKKSLGGYSPRESYRERFEAVRDLPPLQQMQAVDMVTYLPGDILVKTDRATMAYSLEARAPWLDYRMAELACRLPTSFKLQGKVGKFAFKQAVAQYVPAAILRRSKMGFSVPLGQWLRTNLKPTFERLVLNAAMEEYLSLKEVRRLWREHQSGYRHHDEKLWNLFMFAGWEARHKSHRDVLSELRRDDIL